MALWMIAAAALAPTLVPPAAPGATATATAEPLAMTVNSWGKPLLNIALAPDGAVTVTSARDVPGGKFGDYDLVTQRFRVDAAELAEVRRLLAPARPWAGRQLPCKSVITDLPYGIIRWGAAELVYNGGCVGDEGKMVVDALNAAVNLLRRRGASAPVAGVKAVREPRG
jgi:hypothetical protein